MREYEFNQPLRGNSPHMVYKSLHFKASDKINLTPKKINLLQTIKTLLFPDKNLTHPPSDNPSQPSK